MFDFGAGELLVIGIVALVVIGPKELPGVLRQVGKATGKMRQMAGEFRAQFDEAMREAELEEATKHLAGFKDDIISTATQLNPVTDIKNEMHSAATLLNAPVAVPQAQEIAPPAAEAAKVEPAKVEPAKSAAAKPKRARKAIGVGQGEPAIAIEPPATKPKPSAGKAPPRRKGATLVALEPAPKKARPKLALVEAPTEAAAKPARRKSAAKAS